MYVAYCIKAQAVFNFWGGSLHGRLLAGYPMSGKESLAYAGFLQEKSRSRVAIWGR
jgi:hypothetical protein